MSEIWKEIPEYKGLYEASNLGNIRTIGKGRNYFKKQRKQQSNKGGYFWIKLHKNKVGKAFLVHRLIAKTFLLNIDNKPHINHIDNNPKNNVIENLEWVTIQENSDHKVKQNRQNRPIGEKNPMFGKVGKISPLFNRYIGSLNPMYGKTKGNNPSAKLVLDLNTGIFYDSGIEAAEAKCLHYGTLKNRLNGRLKNNTSLIYA